MDRSIFCWLGRENGIGRGEVREEPLDLRPSEWSRCSRVLLVSIGGIAACSCLVGVAIKATDLSLAGKRLWMILAVPSLLIAVCGCAYKWQPVEKLFMGIGITVVANSLFIGVVEAVIQIFSAISMPFSEDTLVLALIPCFVEAPAVFWAFRGDAFVQASRAAVASVCNACSCSRASQVASLTMEHRLDLGCFGAALFASLFLFTVITMLGNFQSWSFDLRLCLMLPLVAVVTLAATYIRAAVLERGQRLADARQVLLGDLKALRRSTAVMLRQRVRWRWLSRGPWPTDAEESAASRACWTFQVCAALAGIVTFSALVFPTQLILHAYLRHMLTDKDAFAAAVFVSALVTVGIGGLLVLAKVCLRWIKSKLNRGAGDQPMLRDIDSMGLPLVGRGHDQALTESYKPLPSDPLKAILVRANNFVQELVKELGEAEHSHFSKTLYRIYDLLCSGDGCGLSIIVLDRHNRGEDISFSPNDNGALFDWIQATGQTIHEESFAYTCKILREHREVSRRWAQEDLDCLQHLASENENANSCLGRLHGQSKDGFIFISLKGTVLAAAAYLMEQSHKFHVLREEGTRTGSRHQSGLAAAQWLYSNGVRGMVLLRSDDGTLTAIVPGESPKVLQDRPRATAPCRVLQPTTHEDGSDQSSTQTAPLSGQQLTPLSAMPLPMKDVVEALQVVAEQLPDVANQTKCYRTLLAALCIVKSVCKGGGILVVMDAQLAGVNLQQLQPDCLTKVLRRRLGGLRPQDVMLPSLSGFRGAFRALTMHPDSDRWEDKGLQQLGHSLGLSPSRSAIERSCEHVDKHVRHGMSKLASSSTTRHASRCLGKRTTRCTIKHASKHLGVHNRRCAVARTGTSARQRIWKFDSTWADSTSLWSLKGQPMDGAVVLSHSGTILAAGVRLQHLPFPWRFRRSDGTCAGTLHQAALGVVEHMCSRRSVGATFVRADDGAVHVIVTSSSGRPEILKLQTSGVIVQSNHAASDGSNFSSNSQNGVTDDLRACQRSQIVEGFLPYIEELARDRRMGKLASCPDVLRYYVAEHLHILTSLNFEHEPEIAKQLVGDNISALLKEACEGEQLRQMFARAINVAQQSNPQGLITDEMKKRLICSGGEA